MFTLAHLHQCLLLFIYGTLFLRKIFNEFARKNHQRIGLSRRSVGWGGMYGRYTKELGAYAKEEARKHQRLKKQEVDLETDELMAIKYQGRCRGRIFKAFGWLWRHTFARLGEDWVFLALLGLIMAVLSFFMDLGISMCNKGRLWLYRDLATNPVAQYFAWVALPFCLILFSAGFVHIVAPQSIGSGIPEMKTILRGVALKEYLTFRTLVAKVIGLTATLGSGLPLGKEGPFVHIASISATLLSKLVTSFQSIYENESRNTEMLAAACAVGVASCFGAPIGGVLFSIEVTTVYFAVRNYWRGFFTAVCGATVFKLLAVWAQEEDTVKAYFQTNFTMEFPFDPQELLVFALMGVICGLGGALYVWSHRQYVLFMRRNKKMNAFLQKNRFLYPGIVILITSSVSFPLGIGRYMAGDINTHDQVSGLFSNFTWTKNNFTVEEIEVLQHWTTNHSSVFVSLGGFMAFTYIFSIIASTIPVPSGSFIPVFKIGAALGRIVGELMHLLFPLGVSYHDTVIPIIPGGYATVGAAAFSGAVTHTISVSVIVFEMTGQITHIIPIMVKTDSREEYERKKRELEQRQRRPSRFEVVPAVDMLRVKQQSSGDINLLSDGVIKATCFCCTATYLFYLQWTTSGYQTFLGLGRISHPCERSLDFQTNHQMTILRLNEIYLHVGYITTLQTAMVPSPFNPQEEDHNNKEPLDAPALPLHISWVKKTNISFP
ncbi:unnamed protein product [Nesidiocoris tenuis]|uniref:Chloride channel protein n=1 Tax=Nesidiocoris tenuis TaxID=355587 RepID=A0A6H5FXB1_9HEMI|nr:unnamed protein product [Nesidiocoris tenuis]